MKLSIRLLLLVLFWSNLAHSGEASLDWNEARIAWHDYEQGMALARQSGKPVLLVFYASWCHTCHSYRDLFKHPAIEALAKELVMIRVNVDSRPDLNSTYSDDGLYLPRSYGLMPDGEALALTSKNHHFRYFYAANDITGYELLMKNIGAARITLM